MSSESRRPATYRTFDEVKETLSPAEQRFERIRRTSGLFAGPVVGVVVYLLCAPLDDPAQRLAGVLSWVVVYWITEAIPIPVTAMLAMAAVIIFGIADADTVFGSFGNSTIFVFIGGFIIAEAMRKHGLDRRFAFAILSIPGVSATTTRIIVAFGAITALLSGFVSNTATAAMMMPIAAGIVGFLASVLSRDGDEVDPQRLHFATALMLMVAYGASVGGLLTPVGSPPNLIGRAYLEEELDIVIPFFQWILLAFPLVAVMFAVLCLLLVRLNRPEVKRVEGVDGYIREERRKLGSMGTGSRNTLIAFGVAVTLWIFPGAVGLVTGGESDFYDTVLGLLDEGAVAIIAASLLFVLPTNWSQRSFTLTWNDAARIDWGTIILFGSGIALGGLLSSTGLAETMGTSLSDLLGTSSLVGITILATVIAVLISETTSNTASVVVVAPIAAQLALAVDVNPAIPVLAAVFGASFGFMLPVSTPPNAIVYGTGMVPITKMVRSGIVFDLAGIVIIVAGVTGMATLLGIQ
ncbi:DASS family sodium-coupled anion symporter [uncultured Aeromicrobium sp.]|uniref:SLC13 family permease n=1 Tax=uncultured Aeromicrobium sp. TaxID=337820 RepID=UPI0025DF3973|nr:DASS family sodium-coupled anion symporter [uncultured Aeromicrobium sp.]